MVDNPFWHYRLKDSGNFVCTELNRSRPEYPRR